MGHEVFVPFSADTVRQALADPVRVSRCIPGFQTDAEGAGEAPDDLTGRLRVRVGNSTITYRGRLRINEQGGGELALEGEGTEARGSGSVKLALTVRLTAADGGSALEFTGAVHSEGRLADAGERAAATVGRRLLDRFAAELAADLESSPIGTGGMVAPPSPSSPTSDTASGEEGGGIPDSDALESGLPEGGGIADRAFPDPDDDNQRVIPGIPSPDNPESREQGGASDRSHGGADSEGEDRSEEPGGTGEPEAVGEPEAASAFETPVPPPSLEPLSDFGDELESAPPAEAAHARRTMIGRSAEEVDHAPPRGRYAPVPVPEAASSTAAFRWAAPAAVALAFAVAIGRIVRRRR